MVDVDTFITALYVMADDFAKTRNKRSCPGPSAALSEAEIVTLAVLGQWVNFPSERAFYRYAKRHLLSAFPTLPDRSQFNRQMRLQRDAITAFGLHLVAVLAAQDCNYEVLDSTAAVTRNAKRRGAGWLAGQADIGWSNREGWYEGFHVLLAVTPTGVITGFGFGPGSSADHHLAETLLAARCRAELGPSSCGQAGRGNYIADKGFTGEIPHQRWKMLWQAEVIAAPHPKSKRRHWPKALRRWLSGLREIIESVNDKLLNTFGLDRERPHDLTGFQARLAAKVGLHNFCIWLNAQLERPPLATATRGWRCSPGEPPSFFPCTRCS